MKAGGIGMVRIALVEDDVSCREQLMQYLNRYTRESGVIFRVNVFSDGEAIVDGYTANYDIILMDIVMPLMNGMEAAEHIRERDSDAVIIFITNTPQYAMKGYLVDALDYVLKPISYYAFSQRIDRALSRMQKRTRSYITVPFKSGIRKLDVSRLIYVEVQDHDLMFHMISEVFAARGTLSELEAQLSSDQFFRCSKCCLVNLEYVEAVQSGDIVVGKETIKVSRTRKKALMDALNNYINEVSK